MVRASFRRLVIQELEQRRLLASGAGIEAQYFSDTQLTSLVASRIENGFVQDWGAGVPIAGLNADQFSARYAGQFEAKYTELHTFSLTAEVGARLWINGIKVVDRWNETSFAGASASLDLVAGRRYDIQLEIRETGGLASFNLQWTSPSLSVQAIATGSLFPNERGSLERRLWNSVPGGTIGSLTSLATFPNQPSSSASITTFETTSLGLDQYGQLLLGTLYPPKTGIYRFYLAGDDTAELWLSNSSSSVGKQRIAFVSSATGPRDWTASTSQQSAPLSLLAGQAYSIEVLHKENNSSDHVAVGWKQPDSNTIEVIDGQFLSPPLPTVRVFSKRADAIEGDTNPIEFVVQRSGATLTNPLTISYSVGGSASSGSDFSPVSGSVTIPVGSAVASVQIIPLSDALFESSESVQIELVDGPGYEVGLTSERQSLATIQNVSSAPSGGSTISPAMVLGNYQRFGGSFSQITPVAPYAAILQATISTVPSNAYDAQLRLAYTGAVLQGDVLWAEFSVRSIGSLGKITAVSEKNSDPYTKSLFRGVSVTNDWAKVQLPFVASESYAAGAATFGFYLGAQAQTLQFADLRVLNYGPNREITPSSLFLNNLGGNWGYKSSVSVSGQPFTSATEITTTTAPPNNENWRLQYGGLSSARARNGDTLQFEFYARGVAGGSPRVAVAIQKSSPNYDTFTFQTINLGAGWQRYVVNTTMSADFAISGLQAMLNVGFASQTVQIAAIKWTNLNSPELPSLVPSITYVGRDAQDTWRADADQRIADTRQSTLTVNVVDSNGNPVNGAVVSVRQKRQSFLFGSAIDGFSDRLSPTGGPEAIKYQSEIKRLFNTATIENSLKWPTFLQNRQRGIDVANWVVNNGLVLRGHNVIWPSKNYMPDSVWTQYDTIKNAQGNAAAATYLRQTIEARIQDAVGTFANEATEWDIVNEPFDNHDVMDVLGNQVVVDWFRQARQVDSDVSRVLNDYDIFARNGNNAAHRANFDSWLTLLKANNAIERIGEQSHYSESNLTDIAVLGQLIQTYNSQFGLPIAITEFDVDSPNAQLQADYLRDYMKMIFSQGAVDQFIQWGFWSQAHWKPNTALYNADFTIRPNGQVYEDQVFGNWWTDTRGTTRGGSFVSDVFEGDYSITVSLGDQIVTRPLQGFTADGSTTITLLAAPTVERVLLNDGSASRSQVTSLRVDFSSELVHGLLASAFVVTNIDTGVAVGSVNVAPANVAGKTTVTLTFTGASTVVRQGTGVLSNSLADGNYRLDIRPEFIRLATGNIAMAANYAFGGQTAAAANNDQFFRLLGDTNGDGVLNGIDLNAIIPSLFNPLGYRADLDTNGDGVINGIDLNALIPTLFGPGRR